MNDLDRHAQHVLNGLDRHAQLRSMTLMNLTDVDDPNGDNPDPEWDGAPPCTSRIILPSSPAHIHSRCVLCCAHRHCNDYTCSSCSLVNHSTYSHTPYSTCVQHPSYRIYASTYPLRTLPPLLLSPLHHHLSSTCIPPAALPWSCCSGLLGLNHEVHLHPEFPTPSTYPHCTQVSKKEFVERIVAMSAGELSNLQASS